MSAASRGLVFALVVVAARADAQELSGGAGGAGGGNAGGERRVQLGLRTGFGLALGKYADVRDAGFSDDEVNALSDDIHGVIPLWLDAGYRLTPRLMLGGYFMFGFVLPKVAPAADPLSGGCPENVDCFATGVRFGLQAQYAFSPDQQVNPWLGLGVGYEWISNRLEGELLSVPIEAAASHSGPEWLHLQGGVDLRVTPALALGPFASLSAMQYTGCTSELGGDAVDCEIARAAWHGWLVLGVRSSFGL